MKQADAFKQGESNVATRLRRAAAVLFVSVLAVALLHYPFAPIILTVGLLLYGALLYRYPSAWLAMIPALLPVFDLAPWSGWFFVDELDFVVLLTLAIGLWRSELPSGAGYPAPALLALALGLLTVSYCFSLMIGLWPLDPLDANAFSNYYSRYNSLRMSKGFFEALGLFWLFLRQRHDDARTAQLLLVGMVAGTVATGIAVVWERFRFSGLFEFASDFRVTATFSGMHNGGNDLEAYLVLAQPFIVALMIFYRNWPAVLGGIAVFLLSTYSLFVTFSRAGLLAIAVNGVLLTVGLTVSLRRRRGFLNPRALLVGTALTAVFLLLVSLVVGGRYFQARLERAKKDWDYRVLQSLKTVEMMNANWHSRWFGMGVGRFPAIVYQRDPLKNRAAAYRFESERENMFLRLYPGNRLYFGQWIGGVRPHEKYRLSFKARAHGQGALSAYLCEKSLQYSFRCANRSFDLAPGDSWIKQNAEIDAGLVGAEREVGGWLSRRPVEFALGNGSKEAVFDVDSVLLFDAAGNNLLANGNFEGGMDRWFFTVDDHTSWQNWNHAVQLYFEQGWFGVLAFLFFVTYLFCRLGKQIVEGNWLAGIALAGLSSFLSVGIFGFLFDSPRMALIYFLIALIFGRGLSTRRGSTAPHSGWKLNRNGAPTKQ